MLPSSVLPILQQIWQLQSFDLLLSPYTVVMNKLRMTDW